MNNPLLIRSLAVLAGYWTFGAFVPGEMLSTIVSGLLLLFGGVTAARYSKDTWRVVVQGKRGEGGDGAHYAIFGVFLLALGSVYSGFFNWAWLLSGQPVEWLSTVYSRFGAFSMVCGFALMFFSPEVARRGIRLLPNWYVVFFAALICGSMFWFGMRYASQDAAIMYPTCPAQTPIKGSASGIYHMPGGRSYSVTRPRACFATAEEAVSRGFRPAR